MRKAELEAELRRAKESLSDCHREVTHLKVRLQQSESAEDFLRGRLDAASRAQYSDAYQLHAIVEKLQMLCAPLINATRELEHAGNLKSLLEQLVNEAARSTDARAKLAYAEKELAQLKEAQASAKVAE